MQRYIFWQDYHSRFKKNVFIYHIVLNSFLPHRTYKGFHIVHIGGFPVLCGLCENPYPDKSGQVVNYVVNNYKTSAAA
jgi:hypothetical protein